MAPCWFIIVTVWLGGLIASQSVRHGRKFDVDGDQETKYIAGIPVYNYQLSRKPGFATASLSDKVSWTVIVDPDTSDDIVHGLCNLVTCLAEGHPRGGVPYFEVLATEEELERLLESAGSVVEFVEPDSVVYGSDAGFEDLEVDVDTQRSLWGLTRVGVSRRAGNGRGVHIYVLDTGIRASHRDFGGRASPALQMIGGRQVCSSSSKSCARDGHGHGTHCSGTAAGSKYGVASGARVYGVQVLDRNNQGSFSGIYGGLDWVAKSGRRPKVGSMSLGVKGVNSAAKSAVDAAVRAGVVVVVAAGNENMDACRGSPGYAPNAFTVGSTDSRDRRSSFSNYGKCVKIWAPGTSITSAGHSGDTATRNMGGTSMACPHVSGAAALVLGGNPGWSHSQVTSALRSSAERSKLTGLKSADTNRLLNVRGLGGSGSSPSPPSGPSPSPPSGPSPSPPSGATRRRRRRSR